MRSHAKARAAGSNQRKRAGRKPALLLVSLATCVAALVVVVGPASGATTRFLVEVFGSSAQPSFPADRGMAVDQGSEALHVIDSTDDTLQRFNADGTPSDFGALGSNVIDGEGTGDETAHGHLAFESNRQREQVAIDESGEATNGNIYVTQSSSDVVDIFSSEGEYLGQLSESTAGGAFGEPCGVAVDSEGTVYVGDRGDDLIHVFEPEALAAAPVNADNTASFATITDPCTLAAGAGATAGFLFVDSSTGAQLRKVDAATGEVKYQIATGASTVSVDPGTGHVFVARNTGSSSSVDEYDASGATEASLVSSFKPGSTVEGIALNSAAEEVYVARAGTEEVEVFGPAAVIPDVTTEPPASNTGTRATLAGTVNPDGVELDECFFEWGEDDPNAPPTYGNATPCAQSPAEIGAGTAPVAVEAEITGLTPQGAGYEYRLLARNPNGTVNGANQTFTTPDTVITQAASAITPTEATLNGTVNPDGEAITECVFQIGPPREFGETIQKYTETAPCVPGPGGIGAGTSPVAVQADLSDLEPGTTYHYRLKAANAGGPIFGDDMTLQSAGPVIEATWAEGVVNSEAILKARINPEGSATTYRFEWGETTAYGSESPESGAGSGTSPEEVSVFLDDLQPGTTYHYRVVATNAVAVNEGPDRTITTFAPSSPETDCPNQEVRIGLSATLPDCRAYEMVTPVDKNGADIVGRMLNNDVRAVTDQAALDGDKLTYSSYKPFGDAQGSYWSNQFMASRGGGGWSSHGISPPQLGIVNFTFDPYVPRFTAFTEDLSTVFMVDNGDPPLMADGLADHYNAYLRHNPTDTYETLTTELFSPANFRLSSTADGGMALAGYSEDGSHVFFTAGARLTPDAASGGGHQIYDYHEGELELVSVLPGGEAAPGGNGSTVGSQPPLGRRVSERGNVDNAISDDGSRVFWTTDRNTISGRGKIYVRIDGTTTVPVSESVPDGDEARYQSASADGSKAFFSTVQTGLGGTGSEHLYEFDVETETPSLITDEMTGFLGASDDASHAYFTSTEALAPGAVAGEENLYLDREGTTTLVAKLAAQDIDDTVTDYDMANPAVTERFARVTPDGGHLAFQSMARLTDYDNRSTGNGEPAVEIYLFDAAAAQLSCVSCKPSGGRPSSEALREPHKTPRNLYAEGGGNPPFVWAAAWLPTSRRETHFTRVLSEDGRRLFFHAHDALVPTDTNGAQDVYQWEAQGKGSCEQPGGCLSLISTGKSPGDSEFIDASDGGRDAFIRTAASIDPRDDGLIDIYDARIGGGFPPPAPAAQPCSGDGCQTAPPPPDDPTPASAAFRGPGTPIAARSCRAQVKRAAKLSRRAKRLRRAARKARKARSPRRARALGKRSARFARKAKGHSKRAKRCRRANRRAGR